MQELTNEVKKVLGLAETFASHSGSSIDSLHILMALACTERCYAYEILSRLGFTEEIAKSYLIKVFGNPQTPALPGPMYNKILEYASVVAENSGYEKTDTQHLLLSLSFHKSSLGGKVLARHGIDYSAVLSIVNGMAYNRIGKSTEKNTDADKNSIVKAPEKAEKVTEPLLNENGTDLTSKAEQGKLSPIFGREKEINRVIQILSRKFKNNPVVVGEPGVGKTAVVEGLAQKIVNGEVPDFLKGKRIFALNVNSLVSGTRYRGELEEKIKNVLSFLQGKGIILFIDELHTIVNAGGSDGGMNLANILKPVLTDGEFSTIGATTVTEYRKFIEKDPALERRFMVVNVEEPTIAASINILKGLKGAFETHHSLKIQDEALTAAAELSARYINDRFLPDKAIDILDEACSKKRNETAGKYAAELKASDIREIIAEMTGIPLQNLTDDESARLMDIEKVLSEKVVGQKEAIEAVAKIIRRSRSGLKDPSRPAGSFIFLGPTGVGKTQTAKALSEFLFGDDKSLIRIDMSEYGDKNSTSRLIGAPPGYVGYEEGGLLTEAVRRKPYSVILLDEMEKAHPEVFDVLLQVLDDGRLTDGKGRTVDFKNTIIIMTSNIGGAEVQGKTSVGFVRNDKSAEEREARIEALKKAMRPEFINRVDNIIVFNKLTKDNIVEIANIFIERIKDVLKSERNIELIVDEETKVYLANIAYNDEYGARPLKRVVETYLEDRLSEEIIRNNLKNTAVRVMLNNGRLEFYQTGG